MTRKGGATISSGNDAVIEPINNNDLLGLGFESEELEMIEHMSQNEIINKYIETADQEYNINLPDINVVIQAAELSDIIPGTQVTKRNIAAQTIHNILNQNAGRSRRRRSRKSRKSRSRKSRSRKSRRTYKRRR
jgi:hypothetical protein